VLDGDPAPQKKRGQPPPNFRPMFIVAKRSPISATAAELLLNFGGFVHAILWITNIPKGSKEAKSIY